MGKGCSRVRDGNADAPRAARIICRLLPLEYARPRDLAVYMPVTYRKVLLFWLPLAFAWLLMTLEGPIIQSVISRKPDSETQLAAFGLVFSLSVLLETPIIMLLATSNALSRDRQSFRLLWRFMLALNLFVSSVALAVAFTPLLDVYFGRLLQVPPHLIEAARPAMRIMALWGAFIGYRRFHQGVIIRFGNTRYVGYGTVVRLIFSAGVAFSLGAVTQVAGAVIGGIALMLAVIAEALYTHYVSRPDVKRLLATSIAAGKRALTYRQALRFHLPLAVTSIVTFLVNPAIERGLASMPDAARSLAAWPVIVSIMLVMRAGGMAYQEVVISLNDSEGNHRILRRFTLGLGFALSLIMLLFSFSPLISLYSGFLLGVPESLRGLVIMGAQAACLLPLLTTLHSYFRALLMLGGNTAAIYQAIVLGFVLTTAIVWGGISAGLHGIFAASLGLTCGQLLELALLALAHRRGKSALRLHWQSAIAPT